MLIQVKVCGQGKDETEAHDCGITRGNFGEGLLASVPSPYEIIKFSQSLSVNNLQNMQFLQLITIPLKKPGRLPL
jgi:hypothetical protein